MKTQSSHEWRQKGFHMSNFTESEVAAMKRDLAVSGYNSLLRLIVLHDKNISGVVSAKFQLSIFCAASGSTAKTWATEGLRGVFVDRALEFAQGIGAPIYKHQLEPTNAIAENWLKYDYFLMTAGHKVACTFKYWSPETRFTSSTVYAA